MEHLNSDVIAALSPEAASGISGDVMVSIDPEDMSGFTAEHIEALPDDAFSAINEMKLAN